MNRKFWITPVFAVLMMAASASVVFASGKNDQVNENDEYGPWNQQGYGRGANGRMMAHPRSDRFNGRGPGFDERFANKGQGWSARPDFETEVFEGTLSIEEGRLPELITDSGDTYGLVVHFPIAAEDLPENGDRISVEAMERSRTRWDLSGTDQLLAVVSAEVNGTELRPDLPEDGFFPGMYGGRGMRGAPMHGGAGRYGNPMFGGRGGFGNPWSDENGNTAE